MQKATGKVPQALRDRPTLTSRQNYLYGIYREIARSRQLSQVGVLPLGVGPVKDYADYFKIRRLDEREEIFYFVGEIDDVYCEIINSRNKEPDKPAGK